LTITLIALCGLFAAVLGRPASQSVAASQAIEAPDVTALDGEDSACDPATATEDAASCADGGWQATTTCCFVSGHVQERWTRNGVRKCCGACFQ
jgi:hypothetical protein